MTPEKEKIIYQYIKRFLESVGKNKSCIIPLDQSGYRLKVLYNKKFFLKK